MEARRFRLITGIEEYIKSVPVLRSITNIQIHHTASPTLHGYALAKDKEAVIRAMWTYHTKSRGFRDIAQHFSVAPDGVWDGRPLDWDSGGFLGAQNIGGICIEIIGNFDLGKEQFTGATAENTYRLVAALKRRWPAADIRFHRDQPGAGKSCPGTSINKAAFEAQVAERLKPKPMTACDTLYALGVSFGVAGWNVKEQTNPTLHAALAPIADGWGELVKIPFVGDLFIKIGEKMKMR